MDLAISVIITTSKALLDRVIVHMVSPLSPPLCTHDVDLNLPSVFLDDLKVRESLSDELSSALSCQVFTEISTSVLVLFVVNGARAFLSTIFLL